MITNIAKGESYNFAELMNKKIESPVLQSEMGLDAAANAAGQAIRFDEFSARHNSDGTIKNTCFKKSLATTPNAIANALGTAVNLQSIAKYSGLLPSAINIVFGGTFGTETATAQIAVTYGDSTTASVTKTATAAGTTSFTNSDLMSLVKDGTYIAQLSFACESSIVSSATTVTFNLCGLYI